MGEESSKPSWVRFVPLGVVLVLVAAGLLVVSLLPPKAVPGKAVAAAGPESCPSQVTVFFKQDDQMRQAAEALRGDKRVRSLFTETRQRAYERFRRIFKDQPELLRIVRPEALPASAWAVPADGVDASSLVDQFRREFPTLDRIEVRPSIAPCPT